MKRLFCFLVLLFSFILAVSLYAGWGNGWDRGGWHRGWVENAGNALFNVHVTRSGTRDTVSNNSITNTAVGDRLNAAGDTFAAGVVAIDDTYGIQTMGPINNLITVPNDITNAAWTKSANTTVIDPNTFIVTAAYSSCGEFINTTDSVLYTYSCMVGTTAAGAGSGYYLQHLYSETGHGLDVSLTAVPEQMVRTVLGVSGGGNVSFGFRDKNASDWENITFYNQQVTATKYKLHDNFTGSATATDNAKTIIAGIAANFPGLYTALYGTDGTDAAGRFLIEWTPGFDAGDSAASVNILSFDGTVSHVRYNDTAGRVEIYDGTNTAFYTCTPSADTTVFIHFRYYGGSMAVGTSATATGAVTWGDTTDFVGTWGPGTNAVLGMSDDLQYINRIVVTRLFSFAAGSLEAAGVAFYGGLASTSFVDGATVDGDAAGRTYLYAAAPRGLRQDGSVSQVKINVDSYGAGDYIKVKVFRPNGANFDYVGESEQVDITAAGVQTHTLATPVSCAPADKIGIFLNDSSLILNTTATADGSGSVQWAAGDITTTDAFAGGSLDNLALDIEANGAAPFLAVSGDSIAEGSNIGDIWNSYFSGGIGGNPEAEIMNRLKTLIDSDTVVFSGYQNHADGGKRFEWVNDTGFPAAVATGAPALLIHCGVLDVSAAHTWEEVQAELDEIAGQISAGQHIFIDEILPWTNGSDSQNATIREYNGYLAAWCVNNSVTLISCHDALGQVRESTGALDDLLAAYDQDGIHLTLSGVYAMAEIWKAAIYGYYGY